MPTGRRLTRTKKAWTRLDKTAFIEGPEEWADTPSTAPAPCRMVRRSMRHEGYPLTRRSLEEEGMVLLLHGHCTTAPLSASSVMRASRAGCPLAALARPLLPRVPRDQRPCHRGSWRRLSWLLVSS